MAQNIGQRRVLFVFGFYLEGSLLQRVPGHRKVSGLKAVGQKHIRAHLRVHRRTCQHRHGFICSLHEIISFCELDTLYHTPALNEKPFLDNAHSWCYNADTNKRGAGCFRLRQGKRALKPWNLIRIMPA